MKKLILTTALALTGLIAITANAQEIIASGYCGGEGDGTNLTWTFTSDSTLTISGSGTMANAYYEEFDIISPWSEYKSSIKTLVIGNGVTTIGDYAFNNCSNITGTLTIPKSVTKIGRSAFQYCSGFTGDLIIPNSVTHIDFNAFYNCSGFTGHLTIPNSVTSLWAQTFMGCSGFTGVTLPDSITHIGGGLFQDCTNLTGTLTIPNSVNLIADFAFSGCNFTGNLIIPKSVETIGSFAFAGCINIDSVKVFWEIPIGPPFMPDASVFEGWDIMNTPLMIPDGTLQAYQAAPVWKDFLLNGINYPRYCGGEGDGTNLTWTLIDSVLTISGKGDMANFNISTLPWWSFKDKLKTLVIGDSVTRIGANAFLWCSFTGNLSIPNSVTEIGESAFAYCTGFTDSLTIPESVTSINSSAFEGCNFTGSATIPSTVEYLGSFVFRDCKMLTEINVDDNNPNYSSNDGILYNKEKDILMQCSAGKKGALTIPNSVISIGDYAFAGCSSLTGILTIPESVTKIGFAAFEGCSGFTGDLIIPNSVTSLFNMAFTECSGFTGNLIIPNSITKINPAVFLGCSGFTGNLIIPNSVTEIGGGAFWGCRNFTGSLTIPNSVTKIGEGAFMECIGFTGSLTIPNSLIKIDREVFKGCSGFTGNLTIPNSVTEIGEHAFLGCKNFTGSLIIPNSVIKIDRGVFAYCSGFSDVIIPSSVTSIGVPMWWTDDPNEYPFSYDVFQSCNGLTSFYVDTNNPNYSSHNGVLFNKDLTKLICYPLAKSDTSYSIPDETVSIGDGAFADGEEENQDEDNNIIAKMIKASSSTGSSMKSISIPISVRTIGTKAFANRKSLTAVYVNWKTPPVITEFDSIFKNIYLRDVKLHIPMGTLSTYLDAPVWQDFNLIESENVAIEQRMEINILNVYPNPTSGVVYIDGIDAVVEVSVFSANGTLVKRTHGNHVDLSTQPAGAYLLRVGNKTARVVKK